MFNAENLSKLDPHSDKLIEVYGETAESIIEGLRKLEIEQNRCAMACQGCGAVFYFI